MHLGFLNLCSISLFLSFPYLSESVRPYAPRLPERHRGSNSANWKNTGVGDNVWRQVFGYRRDLGASLGDEEEELYIEKVLGENEGYLIGYLGLSSKRRDPAMRVLSHGMRDVSRSEAFKMSLDAWTLVEEWEWDKESPDERRLISRYGLTKVVWGAGMTPGLQGFLDKIKVGNELLVVEHFLEVHFTGPIIMAAIELGFNNDDTLITTLAMLRLILNHSSNLAWAPPKLNTLKFQFLNGREIPLDFETLKLFMYLDAMSIKFRAHIQRVIDYSKFEAPNTMLIAVLKIIQGTPFCTGRWQDITYRKQINGGEVIQILGNSQGQNDLPQFNAQGWVTEMKPSWRTVKDTLKLDFEGDASLKDALKTSAGWEIWNRLQFIHYWYKNWDADQAVYEDICKSFLSEQNIQDGFQSLKKMLHDGLLDQTQYEKLLNFKFSKLSTELEDMTTFEQLHFLEDMISRAGDVEVERQALQELYETSVQDIVKGLQKFDLTSRLAELERLHQQGMIPEGLNRRLRDEFVDLLPSIIDELLKDDFEKACNLVDKWAEAGLVEQNLIAQSYEICLTKSRDFLEQYSGYAEAQNFLERLLHVSWITKPDYLMLVSYHKDLTGTLFGKQNPVISRFGDQFE